MAIMPSLYTLSGLEAETGITRRKLGQLLATTPPEGTSERDQPAWRIKTVLRLKELEEGQGLNPIAEKARLDKARADIAEIELSKRRGETVALSSVASMWGDMLINLKTRLRSIPTKAAPLVAAEADADECKDILSKFVDEALTELVENPDYGQAEDSGDLETGDPELEAAAAPDSQPMGGRAPEAIV